MIGRHECVFFKKKTQLGEYTRVRKNDGIIN
jgi:hypothetical protein